MARDKIEYDSGPTAKLFTYYTTISPMTNVEIAREAGFTGSRSGAMVTNIRTGVNRIPYKRMDALIGLLRMPAARFIKTAIEEYDPDLYNLLKKYFGFPLSDNELSIIRIIRERSKGTDPDLLDGESKQHLLDSIDAALRSA